VQQSAEDADKMDHRTDNRGVADSRGYRAMRRVRTDMVGATSNLDY
jgi:hypothetical protein